MLFTDNNNAFTLQTQCFYASFW